MYVLSENTSLFLCSCELRIGFCETAQLLLDEEQQLYGKFSMDRPFDWAILTRDLFCCVFCMLL